MLQALYYSLSALAFTAGSFLISYGIDVSFELEELSPLLYFIFPFLTSFPELAVVALGIAAGRSGPEVSLGTALGEPFAVLTIGVLLFKLSHGESITGDSGLETALYSFLIMDVLLLISAFVRLAACSLFVAFAIYEILVFREFRRRTYSPRGWTILLSLAGAILVAVSAEGVVMGIIYMSEALSIQPALVSYFIIPLMSALPEILAPFVLRRREKKERLASLFSELPIEMSLYAGAVLLFSSSYLPQALLFGIAVSGLQGALVLLEHRTRIRVTLYSSVLLYVLYALAVLA